MKGSSINPGFLKNCYIFLGRRTQAKRQSLQDPNQSNLDNMNNARRDASRHFRKKKKEYLKAKMSALETNSKNKSIRDLFVGVSMALRGVSA